MRPDTACPLLSNPYAGILVSTMDVSAECDSIVCSSLRLAPHAGGCGAGIARVQGLTSKPEPNLVSSLQRMQADAEQALLVEEPSSEEDEVIDYEVAAHMASGCACGHLCRHAKHAQCLQCTCHALINQNNRIADVMLST